MTDPISLDALINTALDKSYNGITIPMFKQIENLTKASGSQLQRALKALDEEAARLNADEKKLTIDNPVLKETLRVIELTFNMVAALIQANDNQLEDAARTLSPIATTAKVFSKLSAHVISQGIDPLSPRAMKWYLEQIRKNGIKWNA